MISPAQTLWENIQPLLLAVSGWEGLWLINFNRSYKTEHPCTLFRICNHSGSPLFLSCTVYGHDASFFHFNPFLCCSLEQKMSPGTNVSSSKTTEQNILIVFWPCFWFLEKIVDNERERERRHWHWVLCWMSFNCCRPAGCDCWLWQGSVRECRTIGPKMPLVVMIRVKQSPCCSPIIVVSEIVWNLKLFSADLTGCHVGWW